MGLNNDKVTKEGRKPGKASSKSSKSSRTESKECRIIKDFDNQYQTHPMDGSRALRFAANVHNNPFATIYIDHHGHLQFLTSESLKERRSEVFSLGFCNNFVRICAQEAGDMEVKKAHDWPDSLLWVPEESHERNGKRRGSVKSGTHAHIKPQSAKERSLWNGFREPGAQKQDPVPFSGESDSESDSEDSDVDSSEYDDIFDYIKVGDDERIERQFHYLFDRIQQHDCKRIAKAWVKAVEPGKQGKYPYNGGDKAKALKGSPLLPANPGDLTRPPWWPETGCKHREPDHIGKKERIFLLKHILQKACAAKGLTYEKLKASTDEIQGIKSRVKPLLNELYNIQKHKERYDRGEIDSEMPIYVRVPTASSRKAKKARQRESNVRQSKARERLQSTSQQPTTAQSRSPTRPGSPTSPKSESHQIIPEATDVIAAISDDDTQLQLYDYSMGHPESNHIPVNASFGSSDSDDWQPSYDDSAISPLTTSSTMEGAAHTPSGFSYNPLVATQQFTIPDYVMPDRPRLVNTDPQKKSEQAQLSYSSGWPLPHSQAFDNRMNLPPDRTQASSMNPPLLANNTTQIFQSPTQHPQFVQMQSPQSFSMYNDHRSSTGYDSQSIMNVQRNPLNYPNHGLPYI